MNRQFLAMCDRIIAEHAYADIFRHKKRTGKRAGYSLSPNTEFLLDVKKAYLAGEISEEEAKAVFLKQRLEIWFEEDAHAQNHHHRHSDPRHR